MSKRDKRYRLRVFTNDGGQRHKRYDVWLSRAELEAVGLGLRCALGSFHKLVLERDNIDSLQAIGHPGGEKLYLVDRRVTR